jgi:hypothetical protein
LIYLDGCVLFLVRRFYGSTVIKALGLHGKRKSLVLHLYADVRFSFAMHVEHTIN